MANSRPAGSISERMPRRMIRARPLRKGLDRLAVRAADARAAPAVDEVPGASELHGRQPFGKFEAIVVERCDDALGLGAVAPQSAAFEQFGCGAFVGLLRPLCLRLPPHGLPEQLFEAEQAQRRCGEQPRDPVGDGHSAPFEKRHDLPVGRLVRNLRRVKSSPSPAP